jgi:putative FmdB family regulatory protein
MPIYEYRCESCGETLEKIQKFSDAPLTDCPACGKSTLKKLVSASSFRLKGSGWYETDFKTKKSTKDAKVDKSNTSGKSSTADSSSSKSDGGSGKSQASGSD